MKRIISAELRARGGMRRRWRRRCCRSTPTRWRTSTRSSRSCGRRPTATRTSTTSRPDPQRSCQSPKNPINPELSSMRRTTPLQSAHARLSCAHVDVTLSACAQPAAAASAHAHLLQSRRQRRAVHKPIAAPVSAPARAARLKQACPVLTADQGGLGHRRGAFIQLSRGHAGRRGRAGHARPLLGRAKGAGAPCALHDPRACVPQAACRNCGRAGFALCASEHGHM